MFLTEEELRVGFEGFCFSPKNLLVSSLQANPITHAGQKRQHVSYPVGCDGYSIPCYSRPGSACEMRCRINEPYWP